MHVMLERRTLPPKLRLRMARDTAAGILYMHRRGIIHRDVKSLNLLITEDYTTRCAAPRYCVRRPRPRDFVSRVADFGLAVLRRQGRSKLVGTPSWMAPELFRSSTPLRARCAAHAVRCRGGMADEKTDVFAFGVVLWELLTQEKPHFGFKSHQVQDFTLSGQRPPIKSLPFGFDPRFIDIICACWHQVQLRRRAERARALRHASATGPGHAADNGGSARCCCHKR